MTTRKEAARWIMKDLGFDGSVATSGLLASTLHMVVLHEAELVKAGRLSSEEPLASERRRLARKNAGLLGELRKVHDQLPPHAFE